MDFWRRVLELANTNCPKEITKVLGAKRRVVIILVDT